MIAALDKAEIVMPSLDERLAEAFERDDLPARVIRSLQGEVGRALRLAVDAAEKAREASLSPALREAARDDAKRFTDAAQFQRDRLEKAREALPARLVAAERREDAALRLAEYTAAKAERDALATDIDELYPKLSAMLVIMLTRLEASNRRVAICNRHLHDWREPIEPAGSAALVELTRIVHFNQTDPAEPQMAWPRPATAAGVQ
jgi:hypothetical protein